MLKIVAFGILFLLSLPSVACEFKHIKFEANFPAANLNDCKMVDQNSFNLNFIPENQPINSSAWYAFKLSTTKPSSIRLTLTFDGFAPRYLPKQSDDLKHWQALPFKYENNSFVLDIATSDKPVYIAGQEIVDNQHYVDWVNSDVFVSSTSSVSTLVLGRSTENKKIHAIQSLAPNSNEWIILLGRQHPPEVTGALSMFQFVETLFQNNLHANKFRERFNMLIVPNLNPDGVEKGNWRHNSKGVDLNRDWKNFEQQETKLIRDYLNKLVKNKQKLVFALDFHSTLEDVFYTIPPEADVFPKRFVIDWLDDIQNDSRRFFKVRNKPGNRPGAGVFKQYIADEFNVHAVTLEFGDNTNRELINVISEISAKQLMKRLSATDKAEFYRQ